MLVARVAVAPRRPGPAGRADLPGTGAAAGQGTARSLAWRDCRLARSGQQL